MAEEVVRDIVRFWLGPSVQGPEAAQERRKVWYFGGAALDAEIQRRFGDYVEPACDGAFEDWRASAEGTLALVLVLDQFTRNIFRATPRAWSGDPRALEVATGAVDGGLDRGLPVTGRIFLYHPFHHAESLDAQDRGVALVDAIRDDVEPHWHEYLDRTVAGFSRHRDIVARFGRFPHRNRILGRPSSPEEQGFLAGEHDDFGQR